MDSSARLNLFHQGPTVRRSSNENTAEMIGKDVEAKQIRQCFVRIVTPFFLVTSIFETFRGRGHGLLFLPLITDDRVTITLFYLLLMTTISNLSPTTNYTSVFLEISGVRRKTYRSGRCLPV
jgi:hypothetical protein